MATTFVYFDLGMVLVRFSIDRMFWQLGNVAGIDPDRVREILIEEPLHLDYELGRLTTREYFDAFCEAAGARPEYNAFLLALSDIFELNYEMIPLVARLQAAGCRTGILSNTCEAHWQFCLDRFPMLRDRFDVIALSYELRACKPDRAIFQAAAQLAGVPPERIFFTDDLPGHVAGARTAGFDAVQYLSAPQISQELRRRRIRFNY